MLGHASVDGDAIGRGDLPDLATAKAIKEQAAFVAGVRRQERAKGRADCNRSLELTCEPQGSVTYELATLDLGEGQRTLTALSFGLYRSGEPVETLGGSDLVVMSRQDDFEVRATATVAVEGQADPEEVPLTIPIGLLVTRGYEGSLEVGSNICPEQRTTTSTVDDPALFSYLVGNLSIFQYSYLDEEGQPCCWHPTEYIKGAAKVAFQGEDAEGHPVWFTRPVELWVDSTPRPDQPCQVRSMQEEPPIVATYDHQEHLEIGSVYLVDQCDNLVQRDSSQAGNHISATVVSDPPDSNVSVAITSNLYQWEHELVLSTTEEGVPPGEYDVTVEADSTGSCSSGGQVTGTFTATVASNQPQVILWWDPADGRGANPDNTLISPAGALRDQTGEIAVWRVPAFQTQTFNGLFPGAYTGDNEVPVRLYVTTALVYFDHGGEVIRDQYLAPLEGVELCIGTVEKQADENGVILADSPVRTTCEPVASEDGVVNALAFSEPPVGEESQGGQLYEPHSWVTMGLGVGITKGPDQPGGYFLVVEPVPDGFRGGSAWAVNPRNLVGFEVGGGVFLDEQYRHTERYIVREPIQGFLLLRSADLPDGTNRVGITSRDQYGQPISDGVQVDLTPVAAGSSLIGPIALYPSGYDVMRQSPGGKEVLDGPRVDVGVGDGLVDASLLAKQPAGALAQCACTRPGQLEVRFLAPGGSGSGYVYSPTQATEIGGPAETWAELVPIEIAAVDPYSTLPAGDPGRIQRCCEDVKLIENGNTRYTVSTRLVYNDQNLVRGGTYLLPNGAVQQPGEPQPAFLSLVDGVAALQLRAVKDAPYRIQVPPGEPGEEVQFPFTTGIQALSAASAGTQLSPSAVVDVAQFVDEASYNRRRNSPNPQALWTSGPNQIRDWLERKWWDYLTDTTSQGDSELEGILAGVTGLVEDDLMPAPAEAQPDGATVKVRANTQLVRVDITPYTTHGYLPSLPQPNPSPFNYFFCLLTMEESRHLWQYRWISQPGRDQDNDQLCNAVPATGNEFLDSNYVAAGGGNRDFYFMGDDQGASSRDHDVSLAFERDAVRYSCTACGVPYTCAIQSPPRLDHVVQSQPSTVVVVTEQTQGTAAQRVGGVSIRWTVEGAGCEPICEDPRTPAGSPCYVTSNSLYGSPTEGVASMQVLNWQGGDCTVRYRITIADSPPQGPPGTVDCVGVGTESSVVMNFP